MLTFEFGNSVTELPDHTLTFTLPDPLIGVTLLAYTRDNDISVSYNVEKTSNTTTMPSTVSATVASATKTGGAAPTQSTVGLGMLPLGVLVFLMMMMML